MCFCLCSRHGKRWWESDRSGSLLRSVVGHLNIEHNDEEHCEDEE